MSLTAGANLPVRTTRLRAVLSWEAGPDAPEIDASAVLLGTSGKVRDDADLVFYNQPRHVSGAVCHTEDDGIEIDLSAVELDVDRIVLAASADGGTFGQVTGLALRIIGAGGELVADFPISARDETAIMGGELYRRGDGWKFRAIGQGYDTGLAGLATDFGIAVDSEPAPPTEDATVVLAPPAPAPAPDETRVQLPPALEQTREQQNLPPVEPVFQETRDQRVPPRPFTPPAQPEWPAHLAPLPHLQQEPQVDHRLEMRKQQVAAALARQGAGAARARVVLVLDASGSMSTAYIDGVVGRIAERCAAVAAVLDIGVMPVWKFADTAMRLPDLQADHAADWARGLDYHGVGLQNDEPAAIRAVLRHVGSHADPTLVLFFADGDVRRNVETKMLMRTSAGKPVFWQFVGLGRADFRRYSKLDTMGLRKIDNCGFVTVYDPDRIPDGRFYDLLLGEFPHWLGRARAAGIIG